jgi:hypothetical protein
VTDYENPWIFNGHPFLSEDINDSFGFVYCITNLLDGRKYIGRKYFYQLRKPRGKTRRVRSESNWKKYYGSSDELNEERRRVGNNAFFRREILSLQATKGRVNFEETRQLFLNNVLTETLDDGTPAYYNSNILGRYYRKDYGSDSDQSD